MKGGGALYLPMQKRGAIDRGGGGGGGYLPITLQRWPLQWSLIYKALIY